MRKQLGIVELLQLIQKRVQEHTNYACYDFVEKNTQGPFFYVEVAKKEKVESKTMYIDEFTIWIHAISEVEKGRVQAYEMVQKIDEAFSEEICLPEEYTLISQENGGLVAMKAEETGENHGVCAFSFKIAYGFKTK